MPHKHREIDRQPPLVAILIRLIVVLKLPRRDAQAETALDTRPQRILAAVPCRPTCTMQLVV